MFTDVRLNAKTGHEHPKTTVNAEKETATPCKNNGIVKHHEEAWCLDVSPSATLVGRHCSRNDRRGIPEELPGIKGVIQLYLSESRPHFAKEKHKLPFVFTCG
ncbi:hypothetical protein CHARACLAT_013370 [Characodon lateralis]|uniref:Uncharacterized protein n=1 Tax=Characodon lateralis TaxID=208331 RepID=A0ABU7D6V2_9TELE|nr:hypothetical protein [Characodon lateralis]